MEIRGKRFLLIGGAGLIGSHTVEALLKEDIKEVIIYDNFARGSSENIASALEDRRCSVYPHGGDILRQDTLRDAIQNIDGVFHFAALWLLQCHEFPESAFDVNVRGTFNVMEACRAAGVERLVYSSSASVYGDAVTEPMTEDHPLANKNLYGATKICGEALLRSYYHRYDLRYAALRYMNVYGPRQDYKGAYIAVIMRMLDAIDEGRNPTVIGDGSEAFDFVAVEDCAQANICAMKADTADQQYNVGTGKKTTLKELAEILIRLTGAECDIEYKARTGNTMVKNRIGCTNKARTEIGFCSKIELEDGLERLIEWRKRHRLGTKGGI